MRHTCTVYLTEVLALVNLLQVSLSSFGRPSVWLWHWGNIRCNHIAQGITWALILFLFASKNAALDLHINSVNIANLTAIKPILQSSTFSGTTWYNLSSVQTGLVVMLYYASKTIWAKVGFINWCPIAEWCNHPLCVMQVSGSLYGALIGSVLAYTIADFLGLSPLIFFMLLLIYGVI